MTGSLKTMKPAATLQPAATPRQGEPHSAFVFSVRDGRLGSITVSDRGATKRVITPPRWSLQFVDQLSATCMAATGSLVFLGDGSGVLYQWATDTGETMIVPAGKKPIHRVLLAPPAPPQLAPDPPPGAAQGRMLLLFGDGTYAVRLRLLYLKHLCMNVGLHKSLYMCTRSQAPYRRFVSSRCWAASSHVYLYL